MSFQLHLSNEFARQLRFDVAESPRAGAFALMLEASAMKKNIGISLMDPVISKDGIWIQVECKEELNTEVQLGISEYLTNEFHMDSACEFSTENRKSEGLPRGHSHESRFN